MAVATMDEKQLYGVITEAYSADPSQSASYEFRYKVVELPELIASHDANYQPNPEYIKEIQPRLRDRAASKTQIESIARNLNPKVLLHDTGFLDTGPMIVGSDNIVESGNGRVLGLRLAMEDYPERYDTYKDMLIEQASDYGMSPDAISDMSYPVLVRERVTPVNRVQFAELANVSSVMGMSPYEQAKTDAAKLNPAIIQQLDVGEDQTIDQALRSRANDYIVKHFASNIPANERATIADASGQINLQGMTRLKLALFTRTYTGEAGQRLARIFGESADPQIKSMENAMFQTLPDMAKAESLIDAGSRDSNLSIAADLAEVIDTYAGIKQSGITIKDYLAQKALFEERLTPLQRDLLSHIDDIGRKSRMMREFMREIAQKVIDAPAKGQTLLMGILPETKEEMLYAVINRQRAELGKESVTPTTFTAFSQRLEEPDSGGIGSPEELAGGVGAGDRKDTASRIREEITPSVMKVETLQSESEELLPLEIDEFPGQQEIQPARAKGRSRFMDFTAKVSEVANKHLQKLQQMGDRRVAAAEERARSQLNTARTELERQKILSSLEREKISVQKEMYEARSATARAKEAMLKAKKEAEDVSSGGSGGFGQSVKTALSKAGKGFFASTPPKRQVKTRRTKPKRASRRRAAPPPSPYNYPVATYQPPFYGGYPMGGYPVASQPAQPVKPKATRKKSKTKTKTKSKKDPWKDILW